MANNTPSFETEPAGISGASGRALAILPESGKCSPDTRPQADFVTQLIACRDRVPAYRRAGRIEPGKNAYGSSARKAAVSGGVRLDLKV